MSTKEGRRGLTNIKDSVDASIRGLEDFMKKTRERIIIAASNNTDSIMISQITTRKQKWEEKHFNRQKSEI